MGKQKGDPNRSKNRPSSSSSAASLLQNSKTLSVGFGGYVGSSRVDLPDNQDKEQTWDVDGEAAVHLRRLSKKDSTTRIKALKALIGIFKEWPASELCPLLPNWIFEYKRLVQDESQQVREGTHNAMSAIAVSVGRDLAPHLRSVMGAWWVSQFDPVKEVSAAAQLSFQMAFQVSTKRLEALMFCADDILNYIDSLLKLSPQTISEKSTPIEESMKKYEQVMSSALLSLAAFLDVLLAKKNSQTVNAEEVTNVTEKKHLSKLEEIESLGGKLCFNHKYFQDYAKSKSSQIRSASYQILRSYAQNIPGVFSGDIDTVSSVVFGSFGDKDPSCHAAMWDMILCVSSRYPEAWSTTSVRKIVLPRFWAFLRHATYGSAKVSYPCILPLLSLLPVDSVKPANVFFKELFYSLWDGHNGRYMSGDDEVVFLKAVQECVLWIINNASRYMDNQSLSLEWIQECIVNGVLLNILWKSYVFAGRLSSSKGIKVGDSLKDPKNGKESADSSGRNRCGKEERFSEHFLEKLRVCIIEILAELITNKTDLASTFWNPFQDVCFEAIINESIHVSETGSTQNLGCVLRISQFLSHFAKQLTSDDHHKKQWLLAHAVRPFVEKLLPLVKETEYNDVINLIANIVSTYGPLSFPIDGAVNQLSKAKEDYFGDEQASIVYLLSSFRTELVPWCLDCSKGSCTAKIELLLSFLEDRRFHSEWGHVLSNATCITNGLDDSAHVDHGKLAVLAVLIEKFRVKFFDHDKSSSWDLTSLDRAALVVAASLSLTSDYSLVILRNVLGGFNEARPTSMISKETMCSIIEILLQRVQEILLKSDSQWAQHAASILMPDHKSQLAESGEMSTALAHAAVKVICGSIFCLESVNKPEIVTKLLSSFFCIYWACAFSRKAEDVHSEYESEYEDSEDDEDSPHHTALSESVGLEIQEIVVDVFSTINNRFIKGLSVRTDVVHMLVQCIKYAVFDDSMDTIQMAQMSANWVSEILDCLCEDGEESLECIDVLLETLKYQPPSSSQPSTASHDRMKDPRHVRYVAFIEKTASRIGWEMMITYPKLRIAKLAVDHNPPLQERYRIWLLLDMLCNWCWPGGSALDTVVPFLASRAESETGELILNNVVSSLFDTIMSKQCSLEFTNKFWMGFNEDMGNVNDPFLRALLVTVDSVMKTDKKVQHAKRFFNMLIVEKSFPQENVISANAIPFILSVLVPVMRKQPENNQSDAPIAGLTILEESVCRWLHKAVSSPSLGKFSSSLSDCTHPLWTVVSCFPLDSAGGVPAVMAAGSAQISSQERKLLLKLFRKETSDGSVAGFVSHLAKHRALVDGQDMYKKSGKQIHQEILAKLVAACVAYCWKLFEADDWAIVLNHMRSWLEAALFEAESFTQFVTDLVKSLNSESTKDTSPSKFVEKVSEEIKRCSASDLSWTAVILFNLVEAVEETNSSDCCTFLELLQSSGWEKTRKRTLNYILQILVLTGMAESLAADSFSAEIAAIAVSRSRTLHYHFWENVSEVVINISNDEKTEAASNLNIWTVGKDPVRALYAILFTSHPIGDMQHAAYSLLVSSSFQKSAICYEDLPSQMDQLDEETSNIRVGPKSPAVQAKLRRELALVLEMSSESILGSPFVSPTRVKYFLAWAIFLSRIRSSSVSSSSIESLVLYVQDTAICNTLLDIIFHHIRLKSELGFSGRQKQSSCVLQAELDRAGFAAQRACSARSISFAIEQLWPLDETSISNLAAALYGLILQVLPACVRNWFTSLRDRSAANSVESFTTTYCSPQLLNEEFSQIQKSAVEDENLSVKANQNIGEVTVVYKKEEAGMDMVIRLPKCYPLRVVDIDCTRRLGINETRLRKWMLSMASFLRNQNGAVSEAIQIWKLNVDREFEGVEECPICYSIIHTSNHSIPRLPCKTCRHKFHAACLYKWFSTSHKSTCPLCQTPF